MSRMIKFFCIAVALFSAAASASWYLQYKQGKDIESPKSGDEKPAKNAGNAKVAKDSPDSSPTRPLIRPGSSPETERITQMAATLQHQQEAIKQREQMLAGREKQLHIIHDEVKKEQKKLDTLRKDIQAELVLVQEKIDLLEKKAGEGEKDRQKAENTKDEIKRAMLEVNTLESKNLKQLANIYDKMDPEAASSSIQQMIDMGKLDMAVTILVNMGNRQAATLLGEIAKADSSVAVQLFDRMRLFKSPTVAPK